jgi:hypothetical protein
MQRSALWNSFRLEDSNALNNPSVSGLVLESSGIGLFVNLIENK